MQANGHHTDPMTMGLILGEVRAESRRQTEISLSHMEETRQLRLELKDLPDRLAAKLAKPSASPMKIFGSTANMLKVAGAMLLLVLVIFGKLTHTEAIPWLRMLIGL